MARVWPLLLLGLLLPGPAPARSAEPAAESLILVGWDGARRERVQALLAAGRLPSLRRLIQGGSFVRTSVVASATVTKPGWAEILTGYAAVRIGVIDNRSYGPIPAGYTVFERLKARSGAGVATIFLSGKRLNLGSRGPHDICFNCEARDPGTHRDTFWWDRSRFQGATMDGKPPQWVRREGEPYLNALPALDLYRDGLGAADAVGQAALDALERFRDRRFFAFIHFEEPDEPGHLHGESSREYSAGLEAADRWLGRILRGLESRGLRVGTRIIVTTDHGMARGGFSHNSEPLTFLVSDRPGLPRDAKRTDVGATVLDFFGALGGGVTPRLDGSSLFGAPRAGR